MTLSRKLGWQGVNREYRDRTRPRRPDLDHGPMKTVFLHVGAPKTGTTYLQDVLWHNRKALAADGVLYPGSRPAAHFHASLDLRGVRFHGHDDPAVPGAWDNIASRTRRWRGRSAVISHETLAWANPEHARRAVESLQSADVHVIYTARDLGRQIPAVWQESVKNRRLVGFPRFLRSLEYPDKPGPWGRMFWGGQDAVDVLRRWNDAVPADRIHVVTVPPPGAGQGVLWERFAQLVGIDPARYDTNVGRSNDSLGSAEAELMRRVNRAIGKEIDWPSYESLFKRRFAERVLAGRPDAERIALPPRWRPWAGEEARRIVEGVREAKYDVVGDLDELIPIESPEATRTGVPRPDANAVLDVAAEAIAQLVVEQDSRARRHRVTPRRFAKAMSRTIRRITHTAGVRG